MRGHNDDLDPLRDPETGKVDHVELRHRMKGWLAVLLAFVVLFGGIGFAAYKGYDAYNQAKYAKDFPGPGHDEVVITIPAKSTAKSIGKQLVDAGVIKTAQKFSDAASERPDLYSKVQAGKYRLQLEVPAKEALNELVDPTRAIRNRITLREGLRNVEDLQVISDKTHIPVSSLQAYLLTTSSNDMGLPGYAPSQHSTLTTTEGFLFPSTYDIPEDATAGTVIKRQIAQYNTVAGQLNWVSGSAALNFGTDQKANANKEYSALIVASIVQQEVNKTEDMPKVARVIYNRLGKGMKLEMDSTTAYANNKSGMVYTSAADRAKADPYNTYFATGLPSAPISNPGKDAMAAALHPADGDWLYFVTINPQTGDTVFSNDQATHDQAVAQLHSWCQTASPEWQKRCGG